MERTIPEDDQGLRQRVEDLTDQVMTLRSRIEELAIQIGDLSGGPNPGAVPQYGENLAALAPVGHERPKASTLLSTTAAVSFLLVIALVLRTASDNGIINLQFGAFMGLLYGFGLFLFDYVRYSRMRRPIPIYAICGGILVFAIDIENRALFEEIFSPLTYIILAVVLLALVALGINLSLPSLVFVGTIGASAAGVSLGFPDLNFPLAAGLLLLANVGAYIGTRLPRCHWMPWGMLVLTMFFWLVWSVKLCHALDKDLVHVESYALPWFLPALAIFMVWYLYLPVVKALRDGNSQAKGEVALPVVTVAWAYPVWRGVFVASQGQVDVAGRVGIAVAIAFMVLALWLFHQSVLGRRTAISFLLASVILWFAALPAAVDDASIYIPVWSLLGLLTAVLSSKWQSGLLRGASYLIQLYACGAAVLIGGLLANQPLSFGGVGLPTAICIPTLCTYVWCRQRPLLPSDSQSISLDPNDRAAIIPLLIAVFSAFGALRILWYAASGVLETSGVFQCGQSVLINIGAISVACVGLLRKDGELLVVSVVIALVGGIRVFAFDLLNIQGLPLVLSVFSFGVTAGVGALIWKRWQLSE